MTHRKIISILLLFCFVGQTVYADMPAKPPVAAGVDSLSGLLSDPRSLRVPADVARVRDVYRGTNGRLIVHIQDAHTNYGAQKNLSKLIGELAREYGMGLVLVEGSSGDVSLDWMKKSVPAGSMEILANQFLERGFISGEEHLNLTSDYPLTLWGLENRPLYDKGLGVYSLLVKKREKILSFLASAQSAIDALKSRLYPKEVVAYEAAADSGFKKSFERLLDLSKGAGADISSFSEVRKMTGVLEREKTIDFSAPEDAAYAGYLSEAESVDMFRFLEEQDSLEREAYDRALSEDDARITRALDRYVGLLKKAYSTRIGSAEFETLSANRPDFPERSWVAFLNQKLVEAGLYDRLIPENSDSAEAYRLIEDFYATVGERDARFMVRTKAKFDDTGDRAAFLIAGGYHTEHLTELWRREGYSYVVLSPVVNDATDEDRYEKLLFAPLRAKPDTYRKLGWAEPGGWAVLLDKNGALPAQLPGLKPDETNALYRAMVLHETATVVGARARARTPEQQAEIDEIIASAGVPGEEARAYSELLLQFTRLVTNGNMNADEITALHDFAQRVSADDFLRLLEAYGYKSEAPAEKSSKNYVIDSDPASGWLPESYRLWFTGEGSAPEFAIKVRADIWRENPAYTIVSVPENEEDSAVEEQIHTRFDIDTPYIYLIPNVNSKRRMMGLAVYTINDPVETPSPEFEANGVDTRLPVSQVLKLSRETGSNMKRLFFAVRSGNVLSKPIVPSEISVISRLAGATGEGRSIPQLVGRVFDSAGSLVERLLYEKKAHYHPRLVVDPLLAKENGHWVVPAIALGEHLDDIGELKIVEFSSGTDMPHVSESIIKYSHSRKVYPQFFEAGAPLRIVVLKSEDKLDKIRADFDARHNPFGYERGKDYEIVSIDDDLRLLRDLRDRRAVANPQDPSIGMIDRLNSVIARLRDRRIEREELEAIETELNGLFLNLGVLRLAQTEPDAPAKYKIVDHAWIGPDEVTRDYLKQVAQYSPLELDDWISGSFERLLNSDGPGGQWKAYYTTEQLVFMRENVKSIVELSRNWLNEHRVTSSVTTFRGVITSTDEAVRIFDLELQGLLTELEHYVPTSRYHLIGDQVKFHAGESIEHFKVDGRRSETAPERSKRKSSGRTGPEKPRVKKPEAPPAPAEKPQETPPPAPAPAPAPVPTTAPAAPPAVEETPKTPVPPAAPVETKIETPPAPAPAAPRAPETPATAPSKPTKAESLAGLRERADTTRLREKVAALAAKLPAGESAALLETLEQASASGEEGAIALVLALADSLEKNALDPSKERRVAASLETLLDALGARVAQVAAYKLRETALQMNGAAERAWPTETAELLLNSAAFPARVMDFADRLPAEFKQRDRFKELLPYVFGEEYVSKTDPKTLAVLMFNLFRMTGAQNPFPTDWNEFLRVFRRNFLYDAPEMLVLNGTAELASQLTEKLPGAIAERSKETDGKSVAVALIPGSLRDEEAFESTVRSGDIGLEYISDVEKSLSAKLAEGDFTVTDIVVSYDGKSDVITQFTAVFGKPLNHPLLGRIDRYVFRTELRLTRDRQAKIGERGNIGSNPARQSALIQMLLNPQGFSVAPLSVFGFVSAESAQVFAAWAGLEPGLLAGTSEFLLSRASGADRRLRFLTEAEARRLEGPVESAKKELHAALDAEILAWGELVRLRPEGVSRLRKEIDGLSAESVAAQAVGKNLDDVPADISAETGKILSQLARNLRSRITDMRPEGNALALLTSSVQRYIAEKNWARLEEVLSDVNSSQIYKDLKRQAKELQTLEKLVTQIMTDSGEPLIPDRSLSSKILSIAMAALAAATAQSTHTPDKNLVESFVARHAQPDAAFWLEFLTAVSVQYPADLELAGALWAVFMKSVPETFPEDMDPQIKLGIQVNTEKLKGDIVNRVVSANKDNFRTAADVELAKSKLLREINKWITALEPASDAFKIALILHEPAAVLNANAITQHIVGFASVQVLKDIKPADGTGFVHPDLYQSQLQLNEAAAQSASGDLLWNGKLLSHDKPLPPAVQRSIEKVLSDGGPQQTRQLLQYGGLTNQKIVALVDNTNPEKPVVHWADPFEPGRFTGIGTFPNFGELIVQAPAGWAVVSVKLLPQGKTELMPRALVLGTMNRAPDLPSDPVSPPSAEDVPPSRDELTIVYSGNPIEPAMAGALKTRLQNQPAIEPAAVMYLPEGRFAIVAMADADRNVYIPVLTPRDGKTRVRAGDRNIEDSAGPVSVTETGGVTVVRVVAAENGMDRMQWRALRKEPAFIDLEIDPNDPADLPDSLPDSWSLLAVPADILAAGDAEAIANSAVTIHRRVLPSDSLSYDLNITSADAIAVHIREQFIRDVLRPQFENLDDETRAKAEAELTAFSQSVPDGYRVIDTFATVRNPSISADLRTESDPPGTQYSYTMHTRGEWVATGIQSGSIVFYGKRNPAKSFIAYHNLQQLLDNILPDSVVIVAPHSIPLADLKPEDLRILNVQKPLTLPGVSNPKPFEHHVEPVPPGDPLLSALRDEAAAVAGDVMNSILRNPIKNGFTIVELDGKKWVIVQIQDEKGMVLKADRTVSGQVRWGSWSLRRGGSLESDLDRMPDTWRFFLMPYQDTPQDAPQNIFEIRRTVSHPAVTGYERSIHSANITGGPRELELQWLQKHFAGLDAETLETAEANLTAFSAAPDNYRVLGFTVRPKPGSGVPSDVQIVASMAAPGLSGMFRGGVFIPYEGALQSTDAPRYYRLESILEGAPRDATILAAPANIRVADLKPKDIVLMRFTRKAAPAPAAEAPTAPAKTETFKYDQIPVADKELERAVYEEAAAMRNPNRPASFSDTIQVVVLQDPNGKLWTPSIMQVGTQFEIEAGDPSATTSAALPSLTIKARRVEKQRIEGPDKPLDGGSAPAPLHFKYRRAMDDPGHMLDGIPGEWRIFSVKANLALNPGSGQPLDPNDVTEVKRRAVPSSNTSVSGSFSFTAQGADSRSKSVALGAVQKRFAELDPETREQAEQNLTAFSEALQDYRVLDYFSIVQQKTTAWDPATKRNVPATATYPEHRPATPIPSGTFAGGIVLSGPNKTIFYNLAGLLDGISENAVILAAPKSKRVEDLKPEDLVVVQRHAAPAAKPSASAKSQTPTAPPVASQAEIDAWKKLGLEPVTESDAGQRQELVTAIMERPIADRLENVDAMGKAFLEMVELWLEAIRLNWKGSNHLKLDAQNTLQQIKAEMRTASHNLRTQRSVRALLDSTRPYLKFQVWAQKYRSNMPMTHKAADRFKRHSDAYVRYSDQASAIFDNYSEFRLRPGAPAASNYSVLAIVDPSGEILTYRNVSKATTASFGNPSGTKTLTADQAKALIAGGNASGYIFAAIPSDTPDFKMPTPQTLVLLRGVSPAPAPAAPAPAAPAPVIDTAGWSTLGLEKISDADLHATVVKAMRETPYTTVTVSANADRSKSALKRFIAIFRSAIRHHGPGNGAARAALWEQLKEIGERCEDGFRFLKDDLTFAAMEAHSEPWKDLMQFLQINGAVLQHLSEAERQEIAVILQSIQSLAVDNQNLMSKVSALVVAAPNTGAMHMITGLVTPQNQILTIWADANTQSIVFQNKELGLSVPAPEVRQALTGPNPANYRFAVVDITAGHYPTSQNVTLLKTAGSPDAAPVLSGWGPIDVGANVLPEPATAPAAPARLEPFEPDDELRRRVETAYLKTPLLDDVSTIVEIKNNFSKFSRQVEASMIQNGWVADLQFQTERFRLLAIGFNGQLDQLIKNRDLESARLAIQGWTNLMNWVRGNAPSLISVPRASLEEFGKGDLLSHLSAIHPIRLPTATGTWKYGVAALIDEDGELLVRRVDYADKAKTKVSYVNAETGETVSSTIDLINDGNVPNYRIAAIPDGGDEKEIVFLRNATEPVGAETETELVLSETAGGGSQETPIELVSATPRIAQRVAQMVRSANKAGKLYGTIYGTGNMKVTAVAMADAAGKIYPIEYTPGPGGGMRANDVFIEMGPDAVLADVAKQIPAGYRLFFITGGKLSFRMDNSLDQSKSSILELKGPVAGTRAAKALLDRPFAEVRALSESELGARDRAALDRIGKNGARALKLNSTYPVLSFDAADRAFVFRLAAAQAKGQPRLEIVAQDGTASAIAVERGRTGAPGGARTAELKAWAEGIHADLDKLAQRVRNGETAGAIALDLDEYTAEGRPASQDPSFSLALPEIQTVAHGLAAAGFQVQITASEATLRFALSEEPGLSKFAAEPSKDLRVIRILKPSTARGYSPKANEGILTVSVFDAKPGEVVVRDAAGELLAAAEMSLVDGSGDQVDLALAERVAAKKGLAASLQGAVRSTLTNLALGRVDSEILDLAEKFVTLPYRLTGDLLDAAFLRAQLRRALDTAA